MGEGFGEVIDQHLETPSVPSTCRGPSRRRSEVQAQGGQAGVRSTEVGGRRSDGARVREDKEIDSEYGVIGVLKERR